VVLLGLVSCGSTSNSGAAFATTTTSGAPVTTVTSTPSSTSEVRVEARIPVSEDPSLLDNQWNDVADRVGPDTVADAVGADDCLADVPSPLADRELIGDPIADLSSGAVASVYGSDHPLDQVTVFETLAEYPDPSTPTDLDAVLDAWEDAGFAGGVAAKSQVGNNLVKATAVEFRSPDDAKAAVTAHLRDLCHRAVSSKVLGDGAGMMMLRESGAVRSVWVVDRYELSLFVCVCVGENDDERQDHVLSWYEFLDGNWSAPVDGSTAAPGSDVA